MRNRIENGQYPRVVTEGRTEEKLASIERSAYLRSCRRSLRGASGTLFVHGLSLSATDTHLLELLEARDSRVEAVYVSVHGDPDDVPNEELMRRARKMRSRRSDNGGGRLDVRFYDSGTAHVWR